jgi:hypothetical protein
MAPGSGSAETLCRPIGAAVPAGGAERETEQVARQLVRHGKGEHRGADKALGEYADFLFVH